MTEEPEATLTEGNPEGAKGAAPEKTGAKTYVGPDGLVNVEAFEDGDLKEFAAGLNAVAAERMAEAEGNASLVAELQQELAQLKKLVSSPEGVRYLYERYYPKAATAGASAPADDDLADLGEDVDPAVAKVLGKLVKTVNGKIGGLTKQLEQQITRKVAARYEPTLRKLAQSAQAMTWKALTDAYPEAADPEHLKEIERVLGSGRVARDDYEAAYRIANSVIRERRELLSKLDGAAKKAEDSRKARQASSQPKRVDADNLRNPKKPFLSFEQTWDDVTKEVERRLGSLKGR